MESFSGCEKLNLQDRWRPSHIPKIPLIDHKERRRQNYFRAAY
jgi:hypothetical protein